MTKTTIVNIHTKAKFDIYIGRSKKGEPKNKYSNSCKHLWNQIKSGEITIAELIEMDGKVLGCFCNYDKGQNCHGSNFIKAIEWVRSKNA